jgi:hypothetical protein
MQETSNETIIKTIVYIHFGMMFEKAVFIN